MTVASRVADAGAPAEGAGPDASGVHVTDGAHEQGGPRESGIAPARERMTSEISLAAKGDELVQLAIAESTRTEANLNLMLRGLQHLTAGATAALEANTQMACELDAVRDLLGKSQVEELALRQRVRLLEHSLESLRREATRERAFFIEQEDLFLVELLDDHERQIRDLKERLTRVTSREPRLDARATIRPEPLEPTPIGAVQLRTIRIPRPTPTPVPDTLAPLAPGPEAAGDTGSARVNEADTLPPGAPPESEEALLLTRPTSRPPLLQKPDLSTRPLVGYSLGNGEVAEERLGGARISPRKPEG